jgi:hypothetical protein
VHISKVKISDEVGESLVVVFVRTVVGGHLESSITEREKGEMRENGSARR